MFLLIDRLTDCALLPHGVIKKIYNQFTLARRPGTVTLIVQTYHLILTVNKVVCVSSYRMVLLSFLFSEPSNERDAVCR